MDDLVFAYIDESGNTDENYDNRFLLMTAIVIDDLIPIQRSIRTAERRIRKQTKDTREIKAFRQRVKTRKIFLENISKNSFDIYSVAFDLSSIKNMPYNIEIIYTFGMSLLCYYIASSYSSRISFIFDQRYSSENQRQTFNSEVLNFLNNNGISDNRINFAHQDSKETPILRAIDFIAYELYQKYKNNENCYDAISIKTRKEVLFNNISWGKIKKESKTPIIDHPEL